MDNSNLASKYQERLQSIPAPGGGGCHLDLLGVANLGVLAGIPPETIFENIRSAIPRGERRVPDSEIIKTISKAMRELGKGFFVYSPTSKPKPLVSNPNVALRRIIEQSDITDEADLYDLSPVPLCDDPKGDAMLFLSTLFHPDERIFVGPHYGKQECIRSCSAWIAYLLAGGETSPHIVVNPLTGKPAPAKSGEGETYRGDGCVSAYRYCLAEFDTLPLEDQVRFWSAAKLPIVALVHSGGKSIHAWLDVAKLAHVETADEWEREIRFHLYGSILVPLGVDPACSNPSRLARLPGHLREEKGNWQRLFWLSPEGQGVQG